MNLLDDLLGLLGGAPQASAMASPFQAKQQPMQAPGGLLSSLPFMGDVQTNHLDDLSFTNPAARPAAPRRAASAAPAAPATPASIPLPTPRPSLAGDPMPVAQRSQATARPNGAAIMAGFGDGSGVQAPAGAGSSTGLGLNFGPSQNTKDILQSMLLGYATGRTPSEGMRNAALFAGQSQERARDRGQTNMTRDAAIKLGLDPQAAAGLDGKSLAAFVIDRQKAKLGGGETVVVNDRLVDRQTGKVVADFSPQATGERADRGLQPVYGVDADGNPVIMQLGKDGSATQTALPKGVKLSKEPIKIDAGTHFVLIDPVTRQPVGQIPKDIAGEQRQKELGQAQGQAAGAVPGAQATAQTMYNQIDDLLNDGSLDSVVGAFDSRTPNIMPGAVRAQSKIDQIKGQTFLQAFSTLRGAGAITEIEGQKATQAMGRLNQAQGEEDFRAALGDLKSIVAQGVDRLRAMSGGQAGGAPAAPAPAAKVRIYDPQTGNFR